MTSTDNKIFSLVSLVAIVVAAFWGFSDLLPSEDLSFSQDGDFKIENVQKHIREIAREVHHVGTPGHKRAQEYIIGQLKSLGLEPEIQASPIFGFGWRGNVGTHIENIVARVKGKEEGKALMLLSHYDSAVPHALGAADDAHGVATIIEGLRVFLSTNPTPKRDIIILISDAEELGLFGAKAFIKHHRWINDVGFIINFEARGSGGPGYMLMETNGKNSKMLDEFLNANPRYPVANSLMYSIYKLLPNDTDLTPFREIADINGFNFAFIDDHFDYHTVQDSPERVDAESLAHQGDYFMRMIAHFSQLDSLDMTSDEDSIYFNFPLFKTLNYPFSWNVPLFVLAMLGLIALIIAGTKQGLLNTRGVLMGFIPFLIILLGGGLLAFGLWKLIALLNPQYQDILHGFPYNGYQYMAAFSFLALTICFWVYSHYLKSYDRINLFIAPLVVWLLVNLATILYLPGASFLILPVLFGLAILGINLWKGIRDTFGQYLSVLISIPAIYLVTPFISQFPVGLGISMVFISAIFIALLFGLLVPLLGLFMYQKLVAYGALIISVIFFVIASFNNGFDADRKKPNNIVYFQNTDTDESYWITRNKVLDDFLNQFLGDQPEEDELPQSSGINWWRSTYYQPTETRGIATCEVLIEEDTTIGVVRTVSFTVTPGRKVNRYVFLANEALTIETMTINGEEMDERSATYAKNRSIIDYYMGNRDNELTISMSFDAESVPSISFYSTSYDLLSHPAFEIQPRSDDMMPMPFVTGDAIVVLQKLQM